MNSLPGERVSVEHGTKGLDIRARTPRSFRVDGMVGTFLPNPVVLALDFTPGSWTNQRLVILDGREKGVCSLRRIFIGVRSCGLLQFLAHRAFCSVVVTHLSLHPALCSYGVCPRFPYRLWSYSMSSILSRRGRRIVAWSTSDLYHCSS